MGCDDSDGPGHAPRYLDVSHNLMKRYLIIALVILATFAALVVIDYFTPPQVRHDDPFRIGMTLNEVMENFRTYNFKRSVYLETEEGPNRSGLIIFTNIIGGHGFQTEVIVRDRTVIEINRRIVYFRPKMVWNSLYGHMRRMMTGQPKSLDLPDEESL